RNTDGQRQQRHGDLLLDARYAVGKVRVDAKARTLPTQERVTADRLIVELMPDGAVFADRRYRVCVTMDNLPCAVFRAKRRRDSKIEVGQLLASCDLGLPVLGLMDHCKFA